MREITIATVQMKPTLGDSENNLVKMSDFVSKIVSQQKVDLIVFPELITTGYELGLRFTEMAQRIPGPAINLMAQRAADAGVFIAFGLVTKEKVESVLYNSAVMVGPEGELVGAYHKTHLRGEERMAFREGFKLPIFDTGEIGKVGLLLGTDLAFPEVSRSMALDGAELLCVMANWETQYIDEWKTYIRARAYENALFIAAANRVGEDVTMKFGGDSMIVGPRGQVYAAMETDAPPKFELRPELKAEAKSEAPATAAELAKEGAPNGASHAPVAAPALVPAGGPAAPDGTKPAETPVVAAAPVPAESPKPAPIPAPPLIIVAQPAEGYCVARIDLDEVRRYREEFQMIQLRQPTVYRAIVRKY